MTTETDNSERRKKRAAYAKAYRAAHPERKAAANSFYYTENKDRRAAYSVKYRSENMEYLAEYRAANTEKIAEYSRNRRARKVKAGGSHTHADILMLLTLQRKKCAVCQCSIVKSYHIDHIVPLARCGSNDKYNLQLLCPTCNLRKGAKHPIEFMQQIGKLL